MVTQGQIDSAAPLSSPVVVPTPYDPSSPLIHELHLSKDAEQWLRTLSPGMFDNYQQIQGTWNHPFTQFSITLVRDPQFRQAVTEIHGKNTGNAFYGYELSWIILVWILRAWRLSKSPTWLTRLWTQAWVSVVFWIGALFIVPTILWGEAYRTVLSHLAKAFFKHFLA